MIVQVVRAGRANALGVEAFVRPAAADAVLQRTPDTRPATNEEPEAAITWGATARFDFQGTIKAVNNLAVTYIDNGPEDPEEPPEDVEHVYVEVERVEESVRVENPDDPADYVIVNRITSILFQGGPQNVRVRFVYNHPPLS